MNTSFFSLRGLSFFWGQPSKMFHVEHLVLDQLDPNKTKAVFKTEDCLVFITRKPPLDRAEQTGWLINGANRYPDLTGEINREFYRV